MQWIRLNRKELTLVIALIASSSLVVRLLMNYRFEHSSLMYVGVPLAISIVLIWFTRSIPNPSTAQRYWNITRNSLIVMLASSVVLFEGFVCVALYMPIHFFVMSIVFFVHIASQKYRQSKAKRLGVQLLPAFLLVASVEGAHEQVSFDRYNEIQVSQLVPLSVQQIKRNLVRPVDINHDRHWFLELFPMPYKVVAETLEEGDIHEIYFRYHRWFFTNTHEGRMLLKLESVDEQKITTRFVEDTSYISTYLKLHGTEIRMTPVDETTTKISLKISFDRKLDPVWYFGPLQRYGVSTMANFLIADMMM